MAPPKKRRTRKRRKIKHVKPKRQPKLPWRPTKYKPEFAEQATKLCALGATDTDLADFFGVGHRTVARWQAENEEFRTASTLGKAAADERVEKSLYRRALGYSHDAVKIFPPRTGEIAPLIVPYREHVAPSDTACIFWLKNRRPDLWRDVNRTELTGRDGGPIETVTDQDRARALAALLAKTKKSAG